MSGFIMHVGHRNTIDIEWTMAKKRTFEEIVSQLPQGQEREYFASDQTLHAAFPSGKFNCWGVPRGALGQFLNTMTGDAVFFAPTIGVHGGGIYYLGLIKAICPHDCTRASEILWPETPALRHFPHIFFFDSEVGNLDWYQFLDDLGINHAWNPRGFYRQIPSERFSSFGGVGGYVRHLRNNQGFVPL